MQDLLDTLTTAAQVELSLTNKADASNRVASNSTSPRPAVPLPSTAAVDFGGALARTARRSVSPKAKYLEENPSPYYMSLSQPNQEPRFYPNPHDVPITHPQGSIGERGGGGTRGDHGGREDTRGNIGTNNSKTTNKNGEVTARTQSRLDVNPTAADSSDANVCHSPGFGTSLLEPGSSHKGEGFSCVQDHNPADPWDRSDLSYPDRDVSGVSPCDRAESTEAVTENSDEAGSNGSNRRRRTAAGVRAQELVAAKFAGMRAAAAAAAEASQGAGTANANASVSCASGKGSFNLCVFSPLFF